MRGCGIEQRLEAVTGDLLATASGNTMRSIVGLSNNDPITLYAVAIKGSNTLSPIGIWEEGSSVFHLQESSISVGQLAAGSAKTAFARLDNTVTRGLVVCSATWIPGVSVIAHSGERSSSTVSAGVNPTGQRYLQSNDRWLKVFAFRGVHPIGQRRRIEALLSLGYLGTPLGAAGPPVVERSTGGTTSNIAGQAGILLEPLTMYLAYTADGTASASYPTMIQVYSDSTRRAVFQGRPTGTNGASVRLDTVGKANQSFAVVGGREKGLHTMVMRINSGLTQLDFQADEIKSPTLAVVPGDGIGRTIFHLSPTVSDIRSLHGIVYNQRHTDAQVNTITSWLRREYHDRA
jgi:hypothetical protein